MTEDYHIHCEFSNDSEYEMESVIKDAIDMGLDEICFTDHVDYGINRDWDDPRGIVFRRGGFDEPEWIPMSNVNYPEYYKKIQYMSDKYKDKITVKIGVEFGIQKHTIPLYEKLFAAYPFDFIILSVHEIDNKEFWTQDYQKGKSKEEYTVGYYEELLKIVRLYKNYSVIGHMDLISRYNEEGPIPFKTISPIVTEILRTIIDDGKGIELNTSSFRYKLNDLTPERNILKLYKNLGGKIVTIGSDSHKKSHLGFHVLEAKNELKNIGFTEFCTFEKMKPTFHDL